MNLSWSSLPNILSVLRIFLVVPCVWWLGQHNYAATLAVFMMAALTDAADGGLAKRYGWASRLGSLLDPIADKILVGGVIVTLGVQAYVPVWWAGVIIARDIVIVGGALLYRYWVGFLEGRPTVVSKLNTCLQLLSVMAIIAQEAWQMHFNGNLMNGLLAVTFLTTCISGFDYVISTVRRARVERPLILD